MKPKVFVTRKLPEEALSILRRHCDYEIWDEEDIPVPRSKLLNSVSEVQAILCLLTERIDDEVLDRAPNLKIVANMAVGFDNIDVDACTRRGVKVTNTPGVLTETTADLAFGLLLAAARRIPEAERVLRRGDWKTWSPMFMAGRDVYGATLGILGLGRIGEAVARRATGFSMRILYWDQVRRPDVEEKLGARFVSLEELLRESDFVSIHLPLTPNTRGLIGKRELEMMKPTAVLVNTARGPIVKQGDLYEALVAGKIWAAGLDVFEEEPVSPDDPLVKLDNVVALPHIASASVATRTRMAVMAAENVVAMLTGHTPPNLVNP